MSNLTITLPNVFYIRQLRNSIIVSIYHAINAISELNLA